MSRQNSTPTYRLHKASGQGIVTLTDAVSGRRKDVFLGQHNSKESRIAYARVLAERTDLGSWSEIWSAAVEELSCGRRFGLGRTLRGCHFWPGSKESFEVGTAKIGEGCMIERVPDKNGIATTGAEVAESELICPALKPFSEAVEIPTDESDRRRGL